MNNYITYKITKPRKEDNKIYGLWNDVKKEFQLGIYCGTPEKTLKTAEEKLHNNIRKWRFSAKILSEDLVKKHNITQIKKIKINIEDLKETLEQQENLLKEYYEAVKIKTKKVEE